MNVVGLTTTAASVRILDGKWFEAIAPADLEPQNIHEAQLAKRLASSPVVAHPNGRATVKRLIATPHYPGISAIARPYSLSGRAITGSSRQIGWPAQKK
jgi:hypothetical protein